MTGKGAVARALATLDRSAFLASKTFGPRRRGKPLVLIVAGVQRSGTNMVMEVIEASRAADVVHERDPRAYDNYHMRDYTVIDGLIARGRRPVYGIKALHESERVGAMLDRFAPARLLWVFRSPDAVIASNMQSWQVGRNMIDDIVVDPAKGLWRGAGMSAATLETLRSVYSPDLDRPACQALFYFYRNQLFFDQGLEREPRARAISYDVLMRDPPAEVARIAVFVGLKASSRMMGHPRPGPERPAQQFDLPPPIRALVDDMHARLCEAANAYTLAGP